MALVLEDFSAHAGGSALAEAPQAAASASPDAGQGYEQGYQAGWDDATEAQVKDQTRIGAELSRCLQDLSFTFHEARAQVVGTVEPLLRQVVQSLLPGIATEAMLALAVAELQPAIDACASCTTELLVAPASRPAVEHCLAQIDSYGIILAEEPSLAEGQAFLRVGKSEFQIDVAGAIERIATAIRSLHALNERTLKHA